MMNMPPYEYSDTDWYARRMKMITEEEYYQGYLTIGWYWNSTHEFIISPDHKWAAQFFKGIGYILNLEKMNETNP